MQEIINDNDWSVLRILFQEFFVTDLTVAFFGARFLGESDFFQGRGGCGEDFLDLGV